MTITINQNPIVQFTADDTTGCFPLTVNFSDQTIPGNASATFAGWTWDFGDGQQSNQKNPSHTYRNLAGNYPVSLTVTNNEGCKSTLTKKPYIIIPDGVIDTFSTISAAGCKLPITLNTNNLSSGPGTMSYTWDFGDGSPTISSFNATHTYNIPNTYPIKLVAASSNGCTDSLTIPTLITAGNVQSNFSVPSDSICVNSSLNFTNTSTPQPTQSNWDFGNGNTSTMISPQNIPFNTANVYKVKLVNTFGACIDSVIKNITVLNIPTVTINASPMAACDSVFTINFTGQSNPNAKSWYWTFGDGGSSNVQNPVYTYKNFGTYTVTLNASSTTSCSSSSPSIVVQSRKPFLALDSLNSRGCQPFNYTPSIIDTIPDGIKTYSWDFGDGYKTNSASPSHVYNNVGTYIVQLTVTTNGGCTATAVDTVKVGNVKPVVTVSASPNPVCVNAGVSFTGSATNAPDEWLWQFGDGSISKLQNPTHSYQSPGTFTATLKAYVNGCNDSNKVSILVNGPEAKFGYSYICSSSNTPAFTFSDSTVSPVDSWLWNFGDGSPNSSLQDPGPHMFISGGPIYPVTLTVSSSVTGCTDKVTVNVQADTLVPDFFVNYPTICNNVVQGFFINNIDLTKAANIVFYFGNGDSVNTKRNNNTYYKYTTPGKYTIILVVTMYSGCVYTIQKKNYITVNGPSANFKAIDTLSCSTFNAIFNDLSTTDGISAINKWVWDFGDSTGLLTYTSARPSVNHTYTKQGIYTVKLVVYDAGGCADSLVMTNYITVALPSVSFTTLDSLSCPGSPIQFVNNSKGYGLKYLWNYSDGGSDTLANPTYIFPMGLSTVKLTITDQFGCILSTPGNYNVFVDTPYAAFHLLNPSDTFATCPPLNVDFVFTGSYYKSLKWFFGDGGVSNILAPVHAYALPGTFASSLIVTSHGGCTDTAGPINIHILGPVGSFTYSPIEGCHNLTVMFNLASTSPDIKIYTWLFGPTQSQSTSTPYTSFPYDSIGKYTPYVVLQDTSGCNVPIKGDTPILVTGSRPNFGVDKPVVCGSGQVQFSDSTFSIGNISSWSWDFGDGSTGTGQNPIHIYSTPGSFDVKLVVTVNSNCVDSMTMPNFIKVVANPSIGISGDVEKCEPASMNFQGVILVPDTSAFSWKWDFGNGKTDSVQIPGTQLYPSAGLDTVQLTATNSSKCSTTVSKAIIIDSISITNAGLDTAICLGTPAQLHASSSSSLASFTWLPPTNGSLSCVNCINPIATPTSTTTYYVKGTNEVGCPTIDSVKVNVVQPSTLIVQPMADSLCLGQSVQLLASGEQKYAWSPSIGLSDPSIANPIARPDTTTIYTLTGVDSLNCFPMTATATISVFKYPTVKVTPNLTTILVGSSFQISASGSPDVVSVNWTPSLGLSCTNCWNPIATPVNTTTYELSATNNGNCTSTDSIRIIVTCNGANFFVANTFSPNGDGVNDWFYVQGKGLSTIQSLRIFDRWGEMVFEKKDFPANVPESGWDGNYKGKKAPIDVYVYTIEVVCENSQTVTYTGNVALIR